MINGFVLLTYFIWTLSILGYGFFLLKLNPCCFQFDFNQIGGGLLIALAGFLGLAFLAVLGIVINFFFPLSLLISTAVCLIGLILFFITVKKNWIFDRADLKIILFLLIYCSLFTVLTVRNRDSGFYHLPAIKWIVESRLPFGLAHLNGRFGFNSSFFILAAFLLPAKVITKEPYFITNAIIMFFYGSLIFLACKKQSLKNNLLPGNVFKKRSIAYYFLLISFIPWFLVLNNYLSSPSPDYAAMIFSFFIFYLMLLYFEDQKKSHFFLVTAIFLACFALTIKLSLIIFLIFLGVYYGYTFFYRPFKDKDSLAIKNILASSQFLVVLVISSIILLSWLARGLILSGCLIYPSGWGHFSQLQWAVPLTQLVEEANWIKSSARLPGVDWQAVLGNWNWLLSWAKRLITHESILLLMLGGGIVINLGLLKKRDKQALPFFPFLMLGTGILFWFFSAPDPRFGYGYLFSFAVLINAYGSINFLKCLNHDQPLSRFLGNEENIKKLFLLSAAGINLLGIFFYLGWANQILINLASLIKKRPIQSDFWNSRLHEYGLSFSIFGLGLILLKIKNRLVGLIGTGVMLFFIISYSRESIPQIKHKSNQTEQGVIIYSPVGVGESWDHALPTTPYFNPALRIKLNKQGLPEYFWLEKNDL